MFIQYDQYLHDVAFSQANISSEHSCRARSNSLLTVTSLFNREAGQNLVIKDLLPAGERGLSSHLRLHHYEGSVAKPSTLKASCFCITDWRSMRTWLFLNSRKSRRWCIAQDIVYIPMHMWDIPSWKKSRPWHSSPLVTTTIKTTINSIDDDITLWDGNRKSADESVGDRHQLCRIAGQVTIAAHMHAQYWSIAKALSSWRQGSFAVSCSAYGPWPHEL